jgi:NAD(P)H dehydrogenase (quinone)
VSDLYAMGFDPVSDRKNFTTAKNPDYYKQQAEEMAASAAGTYEPSLEAEMAKLESCDLLVWHFPLWWFSVPAILKGWADRVLAMGRFYGGGKGIYETGPLKGKRAICVLTTGGPPPAYVPGVRYVLSCSSLVAAGVAGARLQRPQLIELLWSFINELVCVSFAGLIVLFDGLQGFNGDIKGVLRPIHRGIFEFCGLSVLEPEIAFAAAHGDDEMRRGLLKKWTDRLATIESEAPMVVGTYA